jgi:hypothetical protein
MLSYSVSVQLAAVMATTDDRYKVYVYMGQTAELRGERGQLIVGRSLMFKIADRLAELGIDSADLQPA